MPRRLDTYVQHMSVKHLVGISQTRSEIRQTDGRRHGTIQLLLKKN